jgi:micrococcal nuclease
MQPKRNVRTLIAAPVVSLMLLSGCLSKETKQPLPPQQISAPTGLSTSSQIPRILINHCHDGDTCQVKTDGGLWFSVRLAGIDAPEIGRSNRKKATEGQPLGGDARDTLIKILGSSQKVTMNQIDLDPFNRPVVELFVGDTCVNLKMLELGLAERYRGRSKLTNPQTYDAAEQLAKANRVGIWRLKNYESPSTWRKNRKT